MFLVRSLRTSLHATDSRKESRCLSSILFSCQRTDFRRKGGHSAVAPPSVSSVMFPLTREPIPADPDCDFSCLVVVNWKEPLAMQEPRMLRPGRGLVNLASGTGITASPALLFQPALVSACVLFEFQRSVLRELSQPPRSRPYSGKSCTNCCARSSYRLFSKTASRVGTPA